MLESPRPAADRAQPRRWAMSALLVGYARCSTDQQDLTAERDALLGLGVEPERIYVDHGLTGTNRERPGLREALAACRAGGTLVVTKLDRLARSLPDALRSPTSSPADRSV
jgi:DNA invertase Pin-like site-specific DNA recombinase